MARKSFLPRPVRPSVAFADLRAFLANTPKHKFVFAALAVAIPFFFIFLFVLSGKEKLPEPEQVTYVRSIIPGKDQAIRDFHDQLAKQREIDETNAAAERERARANMQEIKEKMDKWGL